ncbi:hypothetical protein M758_UG055200 [Ceratodon purpureus]|nr:hypothetical protein M758_UG055200 [Ceratodon purpureus]
MTNKLEDIWTKGNLFAKPGSSGLDWILIPPDQWLRRTDALQQPQYPIPQDSDDELGEPHFPEQTDPHLQASIAELFRTVRKTLAERQRAKASSSGTSKQAPKARPKQKARKRPHNRPTKGRASQANSIPTEAMERGNPPNLNNGQQSSQSIQWNPGIHSTRPQQEGTHPAKEPKSRPKDPATQPTKHRKETNQEDQVNKDAPPRPRSPAPNKTLNRPTPRAPRHRRQPRIPDSPPRPVLLPASYVKPQYTGVGHTQRRTAL